MILAPGLASTSMAIEVQRLDIVEAETVGGGAAHALARATQRFEHMQRRLLEAARTEIAGDGGRRGGVG